jgi:CRP-like cAMP-binding protein
MVARTVVSVLEMKQEQIDRLLRQRPRIAGALYRSLATELARRLCLGLVQWKS